MCAPAGQCPWWMSLYGSLTPNRLCSCPAMMDRTGGQTPKKYTHTHTQSWFIHIFILKCSFGSSSDSADVTRHGLCTNYVWDSCEWWGPCQQPHRQPSQRGRQAESITQHKQVRSVQNSSWVGARNGLVVRKQHLWTKMDACLTPESSLLCLPRLLNFPAIYLLEGKQILVSWWPSDRDLSYIPHCPRAWIHSGTFVGGHHSSSCLTKPIQSFASVTKICH